MEQVQEPERSYAQIIKDRELEMAIRDRFKAERFPEATVDGEDLDLYEGGDCE